MKKNQKLLKLFIESIINEKMDVQRSAPNIFDRGYHYSAADSVDSLVQSAIAAQKTMYGQGTKSPSDPKFLQRVKEQLDAVRVPEHVADAVIVKLRLLAMKR